MMKAVDRTPTTRRQKLLFSGVVCSHLTWPLLIQEFSATWVEKQLDSITTRYLKRWAGLSKPTNTAILYLPRSLGGLNFPLLSTFHQKLQVSRQCDLLTLRDGCVHSLADHSLQVELLSVRKSFKPAVSARDVLVSRPGVNTKLLVKAAKAVVVDDSNSVRLEKQQRLVSQGQLSRCLDVRCARVWSVVVQSLPEEQMKFALNAALDILPHNNNLHQWKKRQDPSCSICNALVMYLCIFILRICARRRRSRNEAFLVKIANI